MNVSVSDSERSDKRRNLMDTLALSVYIGIPPSTISKWRCTGEVVIPFIKIGNAVRYDPKDIQQWLEENTKHKSSGVKG